MSVTCKNGVATNIRTMEIDTSDPKDVRDTKQLAGLGKDSLSGTNKMEQYSTGGASGNGPWGGNAEWK